MHNLLCNTHHQPVAIAQAIAISNSCLSKPHASTSATVYSSHVRSFACAPWQITEQYTIESLCIYSREYLPLHIVTSTWILALTKLLYKVPFTSTLAKHLHIPFRSHIFQRQCAIGCYLVFQITIGQREILMRGNTMPDCGGSGTFAWTSPTLCTMISCNSKCLLSIMSRSHCHGKKCTNMSVQWQK